MSVHQKPGRHRSCGAEKTRAGFRQGNKGEISAAVGLLALLGAFSPVAFGLWSSAPESICNLPESDDGGEHHVRGRFVDRVLTDPACPGRRVRVNGAAKLHEFRETVDPDGARFGIPLGAGTYTNIELYGRLGKSDQFIVDRVIAYERHDVLDSRWRVHSIEDGVGVSVWDADEQFPFTVNERVLKSPVNQTFIDATVGDEDVRALLRLSNAAAGTLCKVSESAQSLVRLQCGWMDRPVDVRSWVYVREAGTWHLVARTDSVRL